MRFEIRAFSYHVAPKKIGSTEKGIAKAVTLSLFLIKHGIKLYNWFVNMLRYGSFCINTS